MALRFGWKKPAESGDGEEARSLPPFSPQPEKAQQWFVKARQAADSYQYEYALYNYAQGIRLDPADQPAHEAMFKLATRYAGQGGRQAAGGKPEKIEGAHPVDKFAAAEYAWMRDLNSASLALRFLESAVRAAPWAGEIGRWHAGNVLRVLRGQKKPSKSNLVQAKDLLAELGAWDEALSAGDQALQIDPSDSALEAELKNLSAQRTMARGRYEEAIQSESGFRLSVKDLDKQRELSERERFAGGLSIDQRNLEAARRDYERTPDVPDVINRYAQLLKAAGTPESEEMAHEVAMRGHQATGQYRFRMFAGDIRIEQAGRKVAALREKLDGGDGRVQAEYDRARQEHLDLRLAEVGARAKEYPTDWTIRYQLGEIEFERGAYTDAASCFQEAKVEPKLRIRAGYMLGRCFAAENWHDVAITEYKEALGSLEAGAPGARELELAIRYDLMVSLMAQARSVRSLEMAREAHDICSSILRKDINYRDVRQCRVQMDELMRELSPGGMGQRS